MALHVVLRRNLSCFLSPSISNLHLCFSACYCSTAIEAKPSASPAVYEFLTQKHHISSEVASHAASVLSPWRSHLEKYDSVLSYFKQIGFTSAQLERTLNLGARILSADLHKTIKPKIKIFQDLGIPPNDIASIISSEPVILQASLENKLVPTVSWVKGMLGSTDKVARVLKKSGRLLLADLENHTLPNVQTLVNHGLTMDQVTTLLTHYPRILLYKKETLSRCLEHKDKMGGIWSSKMSVYAIGIICSMPNGAWERKLVAFREILEFTEDDIVGALRKNPMVFSVSKDKMKLVKQFILGTGKYDTSAIARYPRLVLQSIEKRCKPRIEVLGMLESKGLIKKWPSLGLICQLTDKKFFEEYVGPYTSQIGEDYLKKRALGCKR